MIVAQIKAARKRIKTDPRFIKKKHKEFIVIKKAKKK